MQPELFKVKRRRDKGIKEACEHAEADVPGWQDHAAFMLYLFAKGRLGYFMAEDFVAFAADKGLVPPPDGRAFGAVMQRGRREGWIQADGYAPSRSSNLSPKVRWRAG